MWEEISYNDAAASMLRVPLKATVQCLSTSNSVTRTSKKTATLARITIRTPIVLPELQCSRYAEECIGTAAESIHYSLTAPFDLKRLSRGMWVRLVYSPDLSGSHRTTNPVKNAGKKVIRGTSKKNNHSGPDGGQETLDQHNDGTLMLLAESDVAVSMSIGIESALLTEPSRPGLLSRSRSRHGLSRLVPMCRLVRVVKVRQRAKGSRR